MFVSFIDTRAEQISISKKNPFHDSNDFNAFKKEITKAVDGLGRAHILLYAKEIISENFSFKNWIDLSNGGEGSGMRAAIVEIT